jgi:hypothetical protein
VTDEPVNRVIFSQARTTASASSQAILIFSFIYQTVRVFLVTSCTFQAIPNNNKKMFFK